MPTASSQFTLSELSARFKLELKGNADAVIRGVGTLRTAGSGEVTFLANPAYRKALKNTQAGAVILRAEIAADCPTNCLISEEPYLAFARLAALFDPRPAARPGIHPSAIIDPTAVIGPDCAIGPTVVIGGDCEIGPGCTIGAGSAIGTGSRIGPGCTLHANVTVTDGVRLGKRVIVHPGAVLGADGFGIAFAGDHWEKVPQSGGLQIGDDCEIGANSCIDRGAIEDTVLEDDVRLDNLVQIGHNVRIGAHTAIAGNAGVAGSTRIGRYCLIAGGAGISGHLEIADRVTITAASAVMDSIPETGSTWGSTLPARPFRDWQRVVARLLSLEKLARTVRKFEKYLGGTKHHE